MTAKWPIGIRLVDVAEPIRPLDDVLEFPRVRVFVANRGEVLGSVDIWNARRPITAERLRDHIAERFWYVFAQQSVARTLATASGQTEEPRFALPSNVAVSVVVPTCGRVEDLRRCLMSLLTQKTDRRVEIIVVDNRPATAETTSVARECPSVTFIAEARPGLSYARNTGFAAATGDILIATDDDVVVPPGWVERLVAPFARDEVAVVTGNVLPLELETQSQCEFEAYGGLGRGFQRFEVDGQWFASLRGAVPTWHLGATANAAFRASLLADPEVGLMDPALGAGTPTGCSEDTYLFYRALKRGWTIVYEPSAYVWHRHRRTMEALRSQIYAYSKGHVAYHLITLFRDGDTRALVRLGWTLPKTYLHRAVARLRRRSDYPLSLLALEIAGNLAGPFALWRARRRVRRLEPTPAHLMPKRRAMAPPPGTTHAVSLESPLAQNPAP